MGAVSEVVVPRDFDPSSKIEHSRNVTVHRKNTQTTVHMVSQSQVGDGVPSNLGKSGTRLLQVKIALKPNTIATFQTLMPLAMCI